MEGDDLIAVLLDMAQPRPGWTGSYSTQQAEGALPNGTRIMKVDQDSANDLTPLGTPGTVLGSVKSHILGIAYFIEWDDKPKCAVLVVAWKIKAT